MNKTSSESFFKKLSGKRQMFILVGILAVATVHFVVQMSFIQSENLRSAEEMAAEVEIVDFEDAPMASEETAMALKPSEQPVVEAKTESFAPRKAKSEAISEKAAEKISEKISLPARRRLEIAPPVVQPKKKVVRETRAARLRRAEKILTGI